MLGYRCWRWDAADPVWASRNIVGAAAARDRELEPVGDGLRHRGIMAGAREGVWV